MQYVAALGMTALHVLHAPPRLRFGEAALLWRAAQDREQNFGFDVPLPQATH